jgi:uncharacterized protein DUF4337
MSADELHELQESADYAHRNPGMAPVSLTMAVLAVLVATATVLGHQAHTAEVVSRTKAHDQMARYQAEDMREHEDKLFLAINNAGVTAEFRESVAKEAELCKQEKDKLQQEAHRLEDASGAAEARGDGYDFAEVFLEIGLVVTSITLLSGRRIFWYLGMVMSAVGVAAAVRAALKLGAAMH